MFFALIALIDHPNICSAFKNIEHGSFKRIGAPPSKQRLQLEIGCPGSPVTEPTAGQVSDFDQVDIPPLPSANGGEKRRLLVRIMTHHRNQRLERVTTFMILKIS